MKFGAAGFNPRNRLIERAGCLEFARDLEDRTDGEIGIEFIGNNRICDRLSCVKKAQRGIVDFDAASTQNSTGGAPYLNVLDYAYMFRSRAGRYYFMYFHVFARIVAHSSRSVRTASRVGIPLYLIPNCAGSNWALPGEISRP